MDNIPGEYDPRYLAGVLLFNRGDFFEAHEVWEELWFDCHGPERSFYQGLIQAAVGLCHFANGNVRGARKLFQSSRDYMSRHASPCQGLDLPDFWRQMEHCFAELLTSDEPDARLQLDEARLPVIRLTPEPPAWPDPAEFVDEEA